MSIIFSLLSNPPAISLSLNWLLWVFWLLGMAICLWLGLSAQSPNRRLDPKKLPAQAALIFAAVVAALFLGIRFPGGGALPPPGVPAPPPAPSVMIFSAIPWLLAGGLFGPLAALITGLLSGLTSAVWDTHSLFSLIQTGLLAVLAGRTLNQRYRSTGFTLLRRPLVVAMLLAVIFPFLFFFLTILESPGSLANRIDYAQTRMWGEGLAFFLEILIAGVTAELVAYALPQQWGNRNGLVASPAERSLQSRFLYNLAPLAVVLIASLMISDWVIAGQAAQNMFRERMRTSAEVAAAVVPYYLDVGESLIDELAADPRLLSANGDELQLALADSTGKYAFFDQLFIFDENGRLLAGHPASRPLAGQSSAEETGIQFALTSGMKQTYTMRGDETDQTALVSFITPILDVQNMPRRVLVGRSSLNNNPLMKPVMESLMTLVGEDGEGMLLDENGLILVHPDPAMIMTEYPGLRDASPQFYNTTAPNGLRRLVYTQTVDNREWMIVLNVPASRAQELALGIALPLLGVILVLAFISYWMLRFGVQIITASLKNLASEAVQIAEGNLDRALPVDGEDEVGNLRRAFDGMRVSLKARLTELNRLLLVSQGVASSLDIEEAAHPLLEAALVNGACAARIILIPSVLPELDGHPSTPTGFGMGACQERFPYLDEQILAISRQQERLVLTSLQRPRLFTIPPGAAAPNSLLSIALRQENTYYGALWIAYDQPHTFSEEEVRYMTTLASQAALAVVNSQLYLNSEIGRQRLAAILASSPDPILVTDQNDHLLLANPAAWQVLGLNPDLSSAPTDGEGQPVERVIHDANLVRLLKDHEDDMPSAEVNLPGGQIFLATASSVLAEGQRVGRVCVLRDITHFKELDALKSEFVSTVSHDLRSPLTLMRGYATMLEMVGQLNEQQTGYVRKIVSGVESMSRLVNNLLDLGRIEAGVGLQPETVLVQDVVERVCGALQIQANQKRIQFGFEILPGTAPMLHADQALIGQALHNLLENAIKYTRPDGSTRLRVYSRGEKITFEVKDSGIGISPMDQTRLFEKFYRAGNQAAREQPGTGLGLAIVKSIAERHGGTVTLESQLGKGSTFYLTIPLQQKG